MKKTTPAIIATFITSTILSAGMLMVGMDAMHISISSAVLSVISSRSAVQFQQVAASTNRPALGFAPTLRTGGS